MVPVAIVFLVFAPQAWSLNVSSVADEAPSLLQGAYQTRLAELEEQVGENPPKQGGDESLDETQPGADVDGLSQLQHLEESKEYFAITPEKGDEMPPHPKSFPGCGCDWEGKSWTCKGTIALPAKVQGNDCCCCTLACHKDSRCTNEQCLAIGVDQAPEIAAEEARRKAILGDADAVLGEVPAYKLSLGLGRPTGVKIFEACKAKNMVPLCDSKNYCGPYKTNPVVCYHPACQGNKANSPLTSASFTQPAGMLPKFEIDPMQFYGVALIASVYGKSNYNYPYGGAMTPAGLSHAWIAHSSSIQIYDVWNGRKLVKTIPASQVDSGQAMGGWHTYCVKEKANR